MSHFTPVASTLGGLLLGVAASLLFALDGRILGISGIAGGLPVAPAGDRAWRAVFLAGLLGGGAAFAAFDRGALALASEQTLPVAAVAGVLVGVGTRMSNGCTSGHGLCGIARLSPRSIVATLVFMAAGAATVFVVRHLLAGGVS
ncbi:MAG TPA: YeeE/YedE thiosulfate transporter family protein [Polyangiaceae bacterium]|jgi:hypothetical protein